MKEILLEYACYDEAVSDIVRANIFEAIEIGAKGISVPITHMSAVANFIPEGYVISCPIDFPYGRSKTDVRIHAATNACNAGATAIDVVANATLLANSKTIDFINDTKILRDFCKDRNITLRLMMDHRSFGNGKQFHNMMKLVRDLAIEFVFCSTGNWSEDCNDNITICHSAQKLGLHAIANGSIYLPAHVEAAKAAKLFGVRFHNINALKNCTIGV